MLQERLLALPLAIIFTGIDQIIFRGKLPFTLKHKHADHETLQLAKTQKKLNIQNMMVFILLIKLVLYI